MVDERNSMRQVDFGQGVWMMMQGQVEVERRMRMAQSWKNAKRQDELFLLQLKAEWQYPRSPLKSVHIMKP